MNTNKGQTVYREERDSGWVFSPSCATGEVLVVEVFGSDWRDIIAFFSSGTAAMDGLSDYKDGIEETFSKLQGTDQSAEKPMPLVAWPTHYKITRYRVE